MPVNPDVKLEDATETKYEPFQTFENLYWPLVVVVVVATVAP